MTSEPSMPAGRSAGHLMVEQLVRESVEPVYSVSGESFLDILDGLYDAPITNVVARHAGGSGFMALAEARLTGRPGVVMVTRGPGVANAMIAIHTAYQDQTSLVMFVGLIPIPDRNRESFQEFDQNAWFGSTAKKVLVLDDPGSAGELVSDAMRMAAGGRPEPVVIGGDGWQDGCGAELAAWCVAHGVSVTSDFRVYDAIPASSSAAVLPALTAEVPATSEAEACRTRLERMRSEHEAFSTARVDRGLGRPPAAVTGPEVLRNHTRPATGV
ncbi:thiamine pyrophosphate-binding protein [Auritidibacter ignavus]|uniref:thiamine pyrophosphate-binding protein n=1 Tax=Auritidibacter ignavus TaxID=678932 RepID=UPI002FE51AAD